MTRLMMLLLALTLSGCSTVTITPKGTSRLQSEPTYSSSKSYYLWGLVGLYTVDVAEICGSRRVLQMQAQDTFTDGLLTLVTFGIYSPRTANVWCEKGGV